MAVRITDEVVAYIHTGVASPNVRITDQAIAYIYAIQWGANARGKLNKVGELTDAVGIT